MTSDARTTGRDWLFEDIPNDTRSRVAADGNEDLGYPYCHQGNMADGS